MIIWILFAVLTVLAALAVLVPLARTKRSVAAVERNDVAVYKDQLAEVDRDLERGVLDASEAEAARTEIARRMVQASRSDRAAAEAEAAGASWRRSAAVAVGVVFVPLSALAVYLAEGSPGVPDQPLAPRIEARATQGDIGAMVARVEAHLAENPGDGRGWAVLAPVYMRMNRYDDAASAYRSAIRILGENAELNTNYGEALVVASGGVVTSDAFDAFNRAIELEPSAVKPRFFRAIALGQEGRKQEAIAAWQTLLGEARGGEAWVPAAQAELARLGGELPEGTAVADAPNGAALPGPGKADVEAAAEMSDADRREMISGMVARLSERLDSEGGSLAEWTRLVRARMVLGDREAARAALTKARAALKDDAAAQTALKALGRDTGLDS